MLRTAPFALRLASPSDVLGVEAMEEARDSGAGIMGGVESDLVLKTIKKCRARR